MSTDAWKNLGIKDGGSRTEMSTGAKREIIPGKGRFDLMGTEGLLRLHSLIHNPVYQEYIRHVTLIPDHVVPAHIPDNLSPTLVALGTEGFFRLARWYELGAIKYADRNWEKGMSFGICFNCSKRHLTKYAAGWKDEDHLAACTWNAFALMEYERTHRDLCDLPLCVQGSTTIYMNRPLMAPKESVVVPMSYHYDRAAHHLDLYAAGNQDQDHLAWVAFHAFIMMEKEAYAFMAQDIPMCLLDQDFSEGKI